MFARSKITKYFVGLPKHVFSPISRKFHRPVLCVVSFPPFPALLVCPRANCPLLQYSRKMKVLPLSDRNQTFIVQKKRKSRRRATIAVLQCRPTFLIITAMTMSLGPLFSTYFYTKQNAHGGTAKQAFNRVLPSSKFHVSKATQDAKATHDRKIHNAAIIAVNPDSKERFLALWSQLECFFGNNDKFGEVIISAPSWAQSEGLIEPFLKNAKETLPHFKDGSISLSLQYYTNDRYDVGLWCDALLNEGDVNLDGIESQSILDRTSGSFIIINDSIMAVERDWTQVLDVLNEKQLNFTSLNYSLQGGYWLESVFRGFSKKGMMKFTEYACKEKTISERCPMVRTNLHEYKRCLVEKYEIYIGQELFQRDEVWGIYPSDSPRGILAKAKNLDTNAIGRSTWVMNPAYYKYLRQKMKFPVLKVSNPSYFFPKFYYNKKWKGSLGTCTTLLDKKLLNPMGKRIHKSGKRSPKYEKWKYLDFFLEEDFKKRDHKKNGNN